MMLFLNILTVALLALVAGLLLAVGQQVRVWKETMKASPLLAEQMATQLLAARHGLESLRKGVIEQGPELSRLLSEGGKLRTELQFLLEKGEARAARLDLQLAKAEEGSVRPSKTNGKQSLIEQIAGANGHAIQPSQPSSDPLEELLAGLSGPAPQTANTRRGPVTQAELALQQRVSRAA